MLIMVVKIKVGCDGWEDDGKVEWLLKSCFGVLLPNWQTDGLMDIGGCRVVFATNSTTKVTDELLTDYQRMMMVE